MCFAMALIDFTFVVLLFSIVFAGESYIAVLFRIGLCSAWEIINILCLLAIGYCRALSFMRIALASALFYPRFLCP